MPTTASGKPKLVASRTIATIPARDTHASWREVRGLILDTLEALGYEDREGLARALDAVRPLFGYLLAIYAFQGRPLVLDCGAFGLLIEFLYDQPSRELDDLGIPIVGFVERSELEPVPTLALASVCPITAPNLLTCLEEAGRGGNLRVELNSPPGADDAGPRPAGATDPEPPPVPLDEHDERPIRRATRREDEQGGHEDHRGDPGESEES
jgi:hypothetical protein